MSDEKYKNDIDFIFENMSSALPSEGLAQIIGKAKKIMVYGAGAGGRYAGYLLSLINVSVSAYIDLNADKIGEVNGIKVIPPAALAGVNNKDEAFIIIGVGSPKIKAEVESMLNGFGYRNVISYIELFNEVFLMADNKPAMYADTGFFTENKEDIMAALPLFDDEKSKSIYTSFIKGHALKDKKYFANAETHLKYFPDDIKFCKGFDCFIDCGASTGETFDLLDKHQIRPELLVMFEPDKYNFALLAGKIRGKNKNAFLYPCAVYSSTGICNFSHSSTQGSFITGNSAEVVQCVRLDDVLISMKPTFIKMDIEGAEYEALLGAESLIREYRPDLAVCVYHAINHIWDIPILLNSLNSGYKMYLRSGNIYGMNTVLFAVSEK